MKIQLLLIAALFTFIPLQAGLRDYYAAACAGFKHIFSYKYALSQKQRPELERHCSEALKEAAARIKENHAIHAKQARKDSNDALIQEIQKPELSHFFTQSKPSFSTIGIFNTSEAAYLLNQLQEKKKEVFKALESENAQESGKSEKPRKITDIRELPALGKCDYNSGMNKYFLSFAANLTPAGRSILRISLIERSPGVKKMKNRQTGEIEDVPSTKKLLKVMVAGSENENNQFEWQRVANDSTQSAEEQICQEASARRANRKRATSVDFKLQ